MKPLVRVYEVLFYDPTRPMSGPAGDGTFVARFRSRHEAHVFAKSAEGPYGGQADVQEVDVPTCWLQRWGME